MDKRKYLLFSLFAYYITFITPKIVSDYLIGFFSGYVRLKYIMINNNNNIVAYKYHHQYYDGELMNMSIKNMTNLGKRNNNIKFFYNKYQAITNPKVPNYSSFTNICAQMLKTILTNSKRKVKVGIIISKRHCLPSKTQVGNYMNIATYVVYPSMSIEEICKIHVESVTKVKNNCKKTYMKLSDVYKISKCNFIFNSHRSLSYIERNDGYKLKRLQLASELPTELEVQKMYNFYNNRQIIVLNNYDNQWIISQIVYGDKMLPKI